MLHSHSQATSARSAINLVVFLSGEPTSLPEGEARAVIKTYDESAKLNKAEDRILLAETTARPELLGRRIAYARRIGVLVPDGELTETQRCLLSGSTYKVGFFRLGKRRIDTEHISSFIARQVDGRVKLLNPEFEVSVICGERVYFALTRPSIMSQAWVTRRPRARAYFHPTALYPKLARAMVNLTRIREGGIIIDPFAGTGSILLEASLIGMNAVGSDIGSKVVRGAVANQKRFNQEWLGIIRSDAAHLPFREADAIATDIPYGRASSTSGSQTEIILRQLMRTSCELLKANSRMVVMHPANLRITPETNLKIEEQHYLYTHRTLTREITILRRTSS